MSRSRGRSPSRERRAGLDVSASSSALDAVLFVLLVGAAVTVLGGIDPPESRERERVAGETADVLATSTTNVTYARTLTVAPGSVPAPIAGDDPGPVTVTVDRRARGTHAELLASAAVAAPSVAGVELGSADALTRQTRRVTRRVLPTRETNAQVRAVWRPYRGADGGEAIVVGDRPPGDADVSVATIAVPSGFPNVTATALERARREGFAGVARALARGIVDGIFPPERVRTALHSEGPDILVVADRYRAVGDALGVATRPTLADHNVTATNARLAGALAESLRADLAGEFETPTAAARTVRIDRVRIVVRTWSP